KPLSNQKMHRRGSVALQSNKLSESSDNRAQALELDSEIKEWMLETYPQWLDVWTSEFIGEVNGVFARDFSYSLSPGKYEGSPLEQLKEFLQVRKVGICEHFASAFSVILRAFNHPVVVAVGFQGGDYNEVGDYWVIRGRDAHAWTMVYQEGKGWVRYDPTSYVAPARLQNGATVFGQEFLEKIGLA